MNWTGPVRFWNPPRRTSLKSSSTSAARTRACRCTCKGCWWTKRRGTTFRARWTATLLVKYMQQTYTKTTKFRSPWRSATTRTTSRRRNTGSGTGTASRGSRTRLRLLGAGAQRRTARAGAGSFPKNSTPQTSRVPGTGGATASRRRCRRGASGPAVSCTFASTRSLMNRRRLNPSLTPRCSNRKSSAPGVTRWKAARFSWGIFSRVTRRARTEGSWTITCFKSPPRLWEAKTRSGRAEIPRAHAG